MLPLCFSTRNVTCTKRLCHCTLLLSQQAFLSRLSPTGLHPRWFWNVRTEGVPQTASQPQACGAVCSCSSRSVSWTPPVCQELNDNSCRGIWSVYSHGSCRIPVCTLSLPRATYIWSDPSTEERDSEEKCNVIGTCNRRYCFDNK